MYDAPYFDLSNPAFSLASPEVMAARERSWYAHTNYGLAVLRHQEVSDLLKDPRLRQGSAAWPAHNGVQGGPFVDWWTDSVLNREGEEHARLRRLLSPAFAPTVIRALVPRFDALAAELIDAFAADGRCEFMSAFATPYAARVTAILLGLPEGEWFRISQAASTLGLALGVGILDELPRIEAALAELLDYADGVIADRRGEPRDDFATRLVQASEAPDGLSERELRDAIVLLIFGGIDTTRNQLGLALWTFAGHPGQWELLRRRPELAPQAVDEAMRVSPTVTWITREAARGHRAPRPHDLRRHDHPPVLPGGRHRPARVRRRRSLRHRRRAGPPLRLRARHPPLPRPLRGEDGHDGGAGHARRPAAAAAPRRRAALPAAERQHGADRAAAALRAGALSGCRFDHRREVRVLAQVHVLGLDAAAVRRERDSHERQVELPRRHGDHDAAAAVGEADLAAGRIGRDDLAEALDYQRVVQGARCRAGSRLRPRGSAPGRRRGGRS